MRAVSCLFSDPGRHYDPTTDLPENPLIPLEIFKVSKGGRYRFRLICAAMDYSFKVSIDNHTMHVVGSDGQPVRTTEVHSVVLGSGERYDVWVEARDPLGTGNYWIRAETMEYRTAADKVGYPGGGGRGEGGMTCGWRPGIPWGLGTTGSGQRPWSTGRRPARWDIPGVGGGGRGEGEV